MNSTGLEQIFLLAETAGVTDLSWNEGLLVRDLADRVYVVGDVEDGTGIEDIVNYVSVTYLGDADPIPFPVGALLVLPLLSRRLLFRMRRTD